MNYLEDSALGKTVDYKDTLDTGILFPIPRALNRDKSNISPDNLPFTGFDIWNGYEFCWLDSSGIPINKFLEILIPCESSMLIESKSLKLYLFSYANSKFESEDMVVNQLQRDLSATVNEKVIIKLSNIDNNSAFKINSCFNSYCLDDLDVNCDEYDVNNNFLRTTAGEVVTEDLSSDLLKSNCLATSKPDWGSIRILYTGNKISHTGLLKYIISYRNHDGFHEHCVESIFKDIMDKCAPTKLSVYARYTRRGGLDINPLRTNYEMAPENIRLFRQ